MTKTAERKEKGGGDFDPSPKSEWNLISQGAEARVWKLKIKTNETESLAVCKERFSKAYRHPDLDARLTKSRCRSEAKILEKCATKTKIRVPKVIRVSPPSLYLEYLDGPSVKSYLRKQQSNNKEGSESIQEGSISENELASQMGELVGRLHNVGIVHGDLTTSNMMVVEESKSESKTHSTDLALIDFGLSKSNFSTEEQAVDLYVLERALLSTHPDLSENFFDQVLEKYKTTTEEQADASGDDEASKNTKKRKNHNQTTLQRLEQVRMRGRKRECFG